MATEIGGGVLTLLDWAKRQDPDGSIAEVVEVLEASNPIIGDAAAMEGNLPTGHRSTQRSTEPAGSWRMINQGVATEKSTTQQVDDQTGMLESFSKVDVDLAILNGNEAAFRASEDNAFIAGLNSTFATALFYGNAGTDPEKFQGLAPRYNSTTGDHSSQIIDAGGSGSDNTSIWIITWGPQTASLIFPKGSVAGLTAEDLGKQLTLDAGGTNEYLAWVTHFQWKIGLAIMDYRFTIRIANIDNSDLTADGATGADILDLLLDGYYARPTMDLGNMARTSIYCNKTIAKFLHKQAQNKSNVNLSIDNAAGRPVVSFLDAPIRVCDALTVAEATVS